MPVSTFAIVPNENYIQKASASSATPQTFTARLKFKKPPKNIEVLVRNDNSVNAPNVAVSLYSVHPEALVTPPAAAVDRDIIGAAVTQVDDGSSRGDFGVAASQVLPAVIDIDIVHSVATSTVDWQVYITFRD